MFQLIESIKLVDGRFYNLEYHQQRMNRSRNDLFGIHEPVDLIEYFSNQKVPGQGLYKCRVIYGRELMETEYVPYRPKTVRSLRVVQHDSISYGYKFRDRRMIDELYEQRRGCDDILIVKNGFVTDSSFANIVFRNENGYFTPHTPLLPGTMRQKLLDDKRIQEKEIRLKDISSFTAFKLINAMLEFESPETEITQIVF